MYMVSVPRNLRGGVFSNRHGRRLRWMICALAILPALPLRAQSVIEFPLPGSRLAYGIAAGPDGALWFTDFLGRVGRITTGGVATEYTVAGKLGGIVAGPDGNLWFTDIGGAQVGRITPSGVVTRFPVSGGTARIPCVEPGGTDRLFQLAGACGIPGTARAVAINAAVTQSGGLGHLTVYPGGSPLPLVSFINY